MFDSEWRTRLADYVTTPEFRLNLEKLKAELDKKLPSEKPARKFGFVLMGIPGAGKSTIAGLISEIYPSVVLSSCWVFFYELKGLLGDYYKAYTYQEELARQYLRQGYSVVMDDNNRTVQNRAEVYRWMRNLGAEPVLIRIEIDPKVAADRQILHGGETRTDEEKLAGLKNVEKEMEEPPQSEGVPVFRINGNKSIAEVTQALKESIATLTVNTVDDNRACS